MAAAILPVSGMAQASGSTADLRGDVTDQNGAVIAGSRITVVDLAKGTTRSGVTDKGGQFVFVGLLPGSYQVKVEAQGFTASSVRIELTVGQQASLPFRLTPAGLEVRVDIVAGGEVVETSRTEQASGIDNLQSVNLPINRRIFLDYALLTPGVADSD
ncbi:MAG: carboxypeptidase-like regulatory domain-containing protein, partial [Acidobacteriota bacterium]